MAEPSTNMFQLPADMPTHLLSNFPQTIAVTIGSLGVGVNFSFPVHSLLHLMSGRRTARWLCLSAARLPAAIVMMHAETPDSGYPGSTSTQSPPFFVLHAKDSLNILQWEGENEKNKRASRIRPVVRRSSSTSTSRMHPPAGQCPRPSPRIIFVHFFRPPPRQQQ